MPLFRKFPEIRKFEIERKNFRKNETVSLEKKRLIKKGEKVWKIGKCIKIPLLNTKIAITYFSVQSGILVQLLSAS